MVLLIANDAKTVANRIELVLAVLAEIVEQRRIDDAVPCTADDPRRLTLQCQAQRGFGFLELDSVGELLKELKGND